MFVKTSMACGSTDSEVLAVGPQSTESNARVMSSGFMLLSRIRRARAEPASMTMLLHLDAKDMILSARFDAFLRLKPEESAASQIGRVTSAMMQFSAVNRVAWVN